MEGNSAHGSGVLIPLREAVASSGKESVWQGVAADLTWREGRSCSKSFFLDEGS